MPLQDTTPQKTCSKCGATLSATTEYFRPQKRGRYGLRADCKACEAESQRAYYAANRDKRVEHSRAWREANPEKAAAGQRAWREANPEKRAEIQRAWREANKEHVTEYKHAYYETNKDRQAEYKRAQRKANPEKHTQRHRDWRKANPDAARLGVQRRRIRRLQAEGTHTIADVQVQYERQKGHCYWCNVKVGDTYDVDHIIPLSRGGTDWPDNLVIACPSCNRSRGDKLPHEWIQGGRLL